MPRVKTICANQATNMLQFTVVGTCFRWMARYSKITMKVQRDWVVAYFKAVSRNSFGMSENGSGKPHKE